MKTLFPIAAAITLLVVPLSSAFAGPSATLIDSCGYVIGTTGGRYALSQDISCTSTHGIVIRGPAPGEVIQRIKLSLNGYTINGSGVTSPSVNGIYVYDSSRVTISGPGRITGFNANNTNRGIRIGLSGRTTNNVSVSGLILDNNHQGIMVNNSATSDVEITNNIVVSNTGTGILISNGAFDNTIEQNDVLYNLVEGIGIYTGCDNNTVIGNNASYNGGITYDNIYVGGDTTGNIIDSNIATNAGDDDIDNNSGTDASVTNNTCFNGEGLTDCGPPLSSDLHIDH